MEATTEFHHKVYFSATGKRLSFLTPNSFLLLFSTFVLMMPSLEVRPGPRQHGDQQEDGHPSGFT